MVIRRGQGALLISEKIDFKLKIFMRDKEGHYIIMRKRSVHHEDITTVNIYSPNAGVPKCIKQIQTELNGEINTIV